MLQREHLVLMAPVASLTTASFFLENADRLCGSRPARLVRHQVQLFGGDDGFRFGKLVLTGTIDENWVKLNLEERTGETRSK